MQMLHIACVQKGNYLGRGAEYVNKLYDMVRRNLPAGLAGSFVCFTDDFDLGYHPDIELRKVPSFLQGWWSKLYLFKEGLFPSGDRVLFFDLDTLIVGPLDDLAAWDGPFAILRDFYRPDGYQSSVMTWQAGFGHHIWERYVEADYPTHDVGGDQSWIERHTLGATLQDIFPGEFVSFKKDCGKYPPKGARVIVFHGEPRPHDVQDGWVPDVWKIGGVGSLELIVQCNTEMESLRSNVKHALSLGLPELEQRPLTEKAVCIVGGGPSLKHYIPELKARAAAGQVIWALNNAARYLLDNGVPLDGQWMVDARPLNAAFVVPEVTKYLASQCAPETFAAAGRDVVLWHEATCDEFIEKRPVTLIGGGTTVGIKAMCGAYALGFNTIHLFGMDSSVTDTHHVYSQPENDSDPIVDVNVEGAAFRAAPWMVRQVEDFMGLADELARMDCEIHVHCGGMLGYVASCMARDRSKPIEIEGNIVRYDGLWRPASDRVSVPAVLGEVHKVHKIIEALPEGRRRTVIQAGGHVGIFANEMAGKFKSVLTFEPDADNFKCLIRNVTHENVCAHNMALGQEAGSIALVERDDHNSGSIGLDPDGVATVPVVAVDELEPESVDLIYLDIEGMEGPALWGASKTIRRDLPLIVCENKGLEHLTKTEGVLEQFMVQHGYRKVARLMRDDVFAPVERADELERMFLH